MICMFLGCPTVYVIRCICSCSYSFERIPTPVGDIDLVTCGLESSHFIKNEGILAAVSKQGKFE